MLIVGLMSGTSLDGVDAALVDVAGSGIEDVKATVVHAITLPYDEARRTAIHDGILAGTAEALCGLHADLGEWLGEAVVQVCRAADVELSTVDAVGSHGQTVWHRPPAEGRRGAPLQLGDAATIAERTGIAVASDFRTRDIAAGGTARRWCPGWTSSSSPCRTGRARCRTSGGSAT